ncbi:hypothetical protein P3T23_002337 [Paraburkholderia sp. GAS448]|jgi:hypothetical protein
MTRADLIDLIQRTRQMLAKAEVKAFRVNELEQARVWINT